MNYRINTPATTWRDKLASIMTAKKELGEYYSIMTAYERATAEREIGHLKEQYFQAITDGVLQEHELAINRLNIAHRKVKRLTQAEIASWDAQKLASEMQVYNMLIDQAIQTKEGPDDFRKNVRDRLEKIYNEAWESGDIYKQRAACEVMKSAPSKAQGGDMDLKMAINSIAQQSKADIEKVRTTPELEKAYQEAEADYQEYRTARQEVINTSQDIGEGDPQQLYSGSPFSRAIRRVQVDRETNEIKILEPDDPEITGAYEMTIKQEVK